MNLIIISMILLLVVWSMTWHWITPTTLTSSNVSLCPTKSPKATSEFSVMWKQINPPSWTMWIQRMLDDDWLKRWMHYKNCWFILCVNSFKLGTEYLKLLDSWSDKTSSGWLINTWRKQLTVLQPDKNNNECWISWALSAVSSEGEWWFCHRCHFLYILTCTHSREGLSVIKLMLCIA